MSRVISIFKYDKDEELPQSLKGYRDTNMNSKFTRVSKYMEYTFPELTRCGGLPIPRH